MNNKNSELASSILTFYVNNFTPSSFNINQLPLFLINAYAMVLNECILGR